MLWQVGEAVWGYARRKSINKIAHILFVDFFGGCTLRFHYRVPDVVANPVRVHFDVAPFAGDQSDHSQTAKTQRRANRCHSLGRANVPLHFRTDRVGFLYASATFNFEIHSTSARILGAHSTAHSQDGTKSRYL